MASLYERLKECLETEQPVAVATVVRGERLLGQKMLVFPDGRTEGTLGDPALEGPVVASARRLLDEGRSATLPFDLPGPDGQPETVEVFIESYLPAPTLFIIGAVHTAIALTHIAKLLGFRVKVIDARGKFATRERFPHADELIVAWPDEVLQRERLDRSTYIVILTHDPKFDEPSLRVALQSNARYIGAIGSRKTSQDRLARLRQQGFSEEQLRRIHAPIGLPIGARTPEEIALAIAAEMIAVKNGRTLVAVETPPVEATAPAAGG